MSGDGPSAEQLLRAAKVTLDRAADWGPAWAQAVAFLARQSLEDAMDSLWPESASGLVDCSASDRLACLPYYLDDDDLARQVSQTWHALSNACHAHPYELDPTEAELRSWIDDVDRFLRRVAGEVRAIDE